MKRSLRDFTCLLLLSLAPVILHAQASSITFFTSIPDFDNLHGPFDVFLKFRVSKDGSDTFDRTLPKDRPGDFFSDDVTFSSPDFAAPGK